MNKDLHKAVAAFGFMDCEITRLEHGLINRTYLLHSGNDRYILQQLNPIFGPEVNIDIDSVTRRLRQRGLATPELLRTEGGQFWYTDSAESHWRCMTYIDGKSFQLADSPARCYAAAGLLAHFHNALWNFDYQFRHTRFQSGKLPNHVQRLREVLATAGGHREYRPVRTIADALFAECEKRSPIGPLPSRIVHGDPKISNILFDPKGQALCLVDLDTLSYSHIPIELGDAFRSWCCPDGEDAESVFDLDHFKAAVDGYLDAITGELEDQEMLAVPFSIHAISVDLAARFCADAIEESYFAWDRRRYASASAHNQQRSRSQLALAVSIRRQMSDIESVIAAALRSRGARPGNALP